MQRDRPDHDAEISTNEIINSEVKIMKSSVPARVLATQLLSVHKQFLSADVCGCSEHQCCLHFTEAQRHLAIEMLTTHIEATRRMGTPGSLKAAATDTIFMASLNETAYEPIPGRELSAGSSLSGSHSAWSEEL
jgi:hypothetical protein